MCAQKVFATKGVWELKGIVAWVFGIGDMYGAKAKTNGNAPMGNA